MIRKNKAYKKIFISILVFVFLFSAPAFSATKNIFDRSRTVYKTEAPPEEEKVSSRLKAATTDANELGIPEDIGLIKESFKGNRKPLIVHIQDAHCNYEAQSNISSILAILTEKKGLELIAVEGSAGEIDTSLFTTFPDAKIREEVADYFMKQGKISGAEYFAINTKKPVILYGIENKEYYLENLKSFTDTLPKQATAKKACAEIKAYLNSLKRYIYNKDLKEFDRKVDDYNEDRLKFVDFGIYLNDTATKKGLNLGKYKNFSYLVGSLKIEEGIDFDEVDKERSTIINQLEKKLTHEDLSDLFNKSLSYRTKKIEAAEYYTYLKDLAESARINLPEFENFNAYVNYLVIYAKIDNPELFKELKNLEDEIMNALCENDEQKRLIVLSKNIRMMEELLNISLSKEDAAYLMKHEKLFNVSNFTTFIKRNASKYALAYSPNPNTAIIDELLPSLKKFYEVAEKREDALLENTLKKMNEKKLEICALISGGYHTEGLIQRFKDMSISYFVVAPRITDLDAESPYLEIISGGKMPKEE